jgi:predicted Rossmann fold flavoprotein
MFDVIIIGAGASGLFLWTQLPKNTKVLIIEKNNTPGNKLLLTWKWRCNFTNLNVNTSHYYWDSLDMLNWYFKEFWPQDMISFLNGNGIETKEEDHWRMFLKSNKSKQLLDFFLKKNEENWHIIKLWETVLEIKKDDGYIIKTDKDSYKTKKIVISTWWKSFPQVWGSEYIFQFSKEFWIVVEEPIPALSWIITGEDLSNLSWSSVNANLQVKNKQGNLLYQEGGVILFTHWWISWPLVFNLTLHICNFYKKLQDLTIKLSINQQDITKRLMAYLKAPKNLKNYILTLHPKDFKDWETAKVMYWGVLLQEVNENFELKKASGIYIIWEALNITWETWWFNLQWCWTSAYHCAKNLC